MRFDNICRSKLTREFLNADTVSERQHAFRWPVHSCSVKCHSIEVTLKLLFVRSSASNFEFRTIIYILCRYDLECGNSILRLVQRDGQWLGALSNSESWFSFVFCAPAHNYWTENVSYATAHQCLNRFWSVVVTLQTLLWNIRCHQFLFAYSSTLTTDWMTTAIVGNVHNTPIKIRFLIDESWMCVSCIYINVHIFVYTPRKVLSGEEKFQRMLHDFDDFHSY